MNRKGEAAFSFSPKALAVIALVVVAVLFSNYWVPGVAGAFGMKAPASQATAPIAGLTEPIVGGETKLISTLSGGPVVESLLQSSAVSSATVDVLPAGSNPASVSSTKLASGTTDSNGNFNFSATSNLLTNTNYLFRIKKTGYQCNVKTGAIGSGSYNAYTATASLSGTTPLLGYSSVGNLSDSTYASYGTNTITYNFTTSGSPGTITADIYLFAPNATKGLPAPALSIVPDSTNPGQGNELTSASFSFKDGKDIVPSDFQNGFLNYFDGMSHDVPLNIDVMTKGQEGHYKVTLTAVNTSMGASATRTYTLWFQGNGEYLGSDECGSKGAAVGSNSQLIISLKN